MSARLTQLLRLPALAAAVLLLGAQSPLPLQQAAQDAALAAAQVLAAGGAIAEAQAAADQAIAAIPGAAVTVSATAERAVTAELAGKATRVAGTVRYQPAEQPAQFAWASRQHFAVKGTPVVVGANCRGDCGNVR